jgi:hypothetical protein
MPNIEMLVANDLETRFFLKNRVSDLCDENWYAGY